MDCPVSVQQYLGAVAYPTDSRCRAAEHGTKSHTLPKAMPFHKPSGLRLCQREAGSREHHVISRERESCSVQCETASDPPTKNLANRRGCATRLRRRAPEEPKET